MKPSDPTFIRPIVGECLSTLSWLHSSVHYLLVLHPPQSEHRTLDIEEADLFYVPVYVNLYMWPIFGWSDGPWWHSATIDGGNIAPHIP